MPLVAMAPRPSCARLRPPAARRPLLAALLLAPVALLPGALAAQDADAPPAATGFPFPPDTRPEGCSGKGYGDPLSSNLTVSVVIPWLKERWEHMQGTLNALVHFTPDALVEEYIFVSDGNPDDRERQLLEISPKVRVINLPTRQGLIRAKMKGVEAARGSVLVFMEAHCIVNRRWLEPLLDRVAKNPKVLAMPTLDSIPADNWHAYHGTGNFIWRYEWNLNLVTSDIGGLVPKGAEPYTNPGTSGGIFAMRKDWFERLGLFDVGMREWGGDHFELTMKVWRCGGRIETVPCSRVGHLFRSPSQRPYPVEINTVVANYKRLAHVWLEDHLPYFYRMKPEAKGMQLGDLTELKRKRDELQCKDMAWYLETVDPEMQYEMSRICHPYVRGADKCKGDLAPGRWTITVADIMPMEEYRQRRAEADARLAAESADGGRSEL